MPLLAARVRSAGPGPALSLARSLVLALSRSLSLAVSLSLSRVLSLALALSRSLTFCSYCFPSIRRRGTTASRRVNSKRASEQRASEQRASERTASEPRAKRALAHALVDDARERVAIGVDDRVRAAVDAEQPL